MPHFTRVWEHAPSLHCRRFTADFMAGHFLDYEPGIHYPQAQMQAGTTGINTFRRGLRPACTSMLSHAAA